MKRTTSKLDLSSRVGFPLRGLPALLLGCVLVVGAVPHAAWADDEPELPVVHRLRLVGNQALSRSELLTVMRTAETSWLPFSEPQRLDPAVLADDLERIVRQYRMRGFHGAQVLGWSATPLEGRRMALVIAVDEGEPTRIQNLFVDGLDDLEGAGLAASLLAEVRELVGEGRRFDEQHYQQAKALLAERLADQGFARVRVQGQVTVRVAERLAEVRLQVMRGPPCVFGRTAVEGLDEVPPWFVEREVRWEEGEPFRPALLQDTKRRIFALRRFRFVRLVTRFRSDPADVVDVVIDVREGSFQSVRASGGYQRDLSTQGLGTSLVWSHRDLFGGARALTVSGDLGYRLALRSDDVGHVLGTGLASRVSAAFTNPGTIGDLTDLTVEASYERQLELRSFEADVVDTRVGLLRRFGHWLVVSGGLSGRAVAYRLQSGADERLYQLWGLLTADGRDDPLFPRNGLVASLDVRSTFGLPRDATQFLRIRPELRGYWSPMPNRLTLLGRLTLGMLVPYRSGECSPLSERFVAGGSGSVRGWPLGALSPLVTPGHEQVCDPDLRAGETSRRTRGNTMVTGVLGLQVRVFGDVWLAGFVDAGDVRREALSLFELDPSVSVGGGVLYRSPVGPIRLDLAWRLRGPQPHLGYPDGEIPSPVGIHFSVGPGT